MRKPGLLAVAPVAAAIAIAGCGGSGAHPAARRTIPPTVKLDHSKLGGFLADGHNRALYLFAADKTTASTCYSACASIWPPLQATGSAKASPGVSSSALGTTKRKDGTTEVTYHGHPLYYYAGDAKPGDTAGEGLNQFGARWYLLAANGNAIKRDAR